MITVEPLFRAFNLLFISRAFRSSINSARLKQDHRRSGISFSESESSVENKVLCDQLIVQKVSLFLK